MKKILGLMVGILLTGANLYAGNGDLIVNGKVGVGTNGPLAKFDVDSPAGPDSGTTPTGAIVITDIIHTGGALSMGIDANTSGFNSWIQSRHINGTSKFNLLLNPNGGNVGIGTTDPQGYRFFISGDFKVDGYAYAKYGGWTGSDVRFKKDILPLEGSLSKLLKLSGVSYEWLQEKDDKKDSLTESTNTEELGNKIAVKNKDFSEGRHFGVIAQDLEKIIPEAVKEDSDGYKAVNYSEIIPVLIEAMKEQQKLITGQQMRIENLEKKVAQLK